MAVTTNVQVDCEQSARHTLPRSLHDQWWEKRDWSQSMNNVILTLRAHFRSFPGLSVVIFDLPRCWLLVTK